MGGGVVLGIRLCFHNHAPEQPAIRLVFRQQVTDELGGNNLCRVEAGMGEGMGKRGGYGSGYRLDVSTVLTTTPGWSILVKVFPGRMLEEQLKAFLDAAKSDAVLREKLERASDVEAVAAIVKDVGFVISIEALEGIMAKRELCDEELESVTGGNFGNWLTKVYTTQGDKCATVDYTVALIKYQY